MRKLAEAFAVGGGMFLAVVYLTLYVVLNRSTVPFAVGTRAVVAAAIIGAVAAVVVALRAAETKR